VIKIAEQERQVEERSGAGEGRQMRRRHDGVVDRDPLAHIGKVVPLQPQRAVVVEQETDRLAVVLLDQILEPEQDPVDDVIVIELRRAMQRDRALGAGRLRRSRQRQQADCRGSGKNSRDESLNRSHSSLRGRRISSPAVRFAR
jgi:hypothetical protein